MVAIPIRSRLFDIIGIDSEHLTCFNAPDGCAFGAGGIHCTTEDTLRLMKLYANGGVWDGVRILSEDYVKAATSAQISTEHMKNGPSDRMSDNWFGYGYQMWMSHIDGIYRAEGANGQYGIVDPNRDFIIACTQASLDYPVSQGTLDRFWEFLGEIDPAVNVLPENSPAASTLRRKLAGLSIEPPPYAPSGAFPYEGKTYRVVAEGAHPENIFYPSGSSTGMTKQKTANWLSTKRRRPLCAGYTARS